jgi:hypothetical protein
MKPETAASWSARFKGGATRLGVLDVLTALILLLLLLWASWKQFPAFRRNAPTNVASSPERLGSSPPARN